MSLKSCCQCCPEPLSTHPAIIYSVYFCAILPLAFIYALDFITEKWAPIRETRRNGFIQLCVSLGSLAYVMYYITLQIKHSDHKEAAAAFAAALLNFYHVLRTIWGLVQLYEFKNWNINALRCLLQLGYLPPAHVNRFKRNKQTIKLTGGSPIADIKRIVDDQMIVNSTVIDNEFFGAELPFQLVISLFEAPFLKCKKPEECSVRWLVSFLAKFGPTWVSDTRRISASSTSRKSFHKKKREVSQDVAVLAALHTTKESGSDDGLVTFFETFHYFCIEPSNCRNSKVSFTAESMLPFKMRGSNVSKGELDISEYEATIRDSAKDDWHKASLNKLNAFERDAVEAVSSAQLACFANIMEINFKGRVPLEIEEEHISWKQGDPRIATFMYQLGYDVEKDYDQFFQELPVHKKYLASLLWDRSPNRLLLQTSVHVDNLCALETGERFEFFETESARSTEPSTSKSANGVYQNQYHLETARIRSDMLHKTKNNFVIQCETPRFTGCVTETVRSILAAWVDRNQTVTSHAEGWNSRIAADPFEFKSSKQLCSAFAKVKGKCAGHIRSLHMRLLWEVQAALQLQVSEESAKQALDIRQYPNLVMLFLLGFPSLKFDGPQASSLASDNTSCRTIQFQDVCTVKPIGGPQTLHITIGFDDHSKMISVVLQSGPFDFKWQDWKDAFMGRMMAQKDWRLARLFSKSEYLWKEANHSPISAPVQTVLPSELSLDYQLTYWTGWPPYICRIAQFEMKKLCEFYNNLDSGLPRYESCGPKRYTQYIGFLNAAMDKHFASSANVESSYNEGHLLLQEGHEDEALKVFGRLIANQGHQDALKDAVNVVLQKPLVSEAQELALRGKMEVRLNVLVREGIADELETLAHYFGRFYESTWKAGSLRQKFLALFHSNGTENSVSLSAIEAGETHIISEPNGIFTYKLNFYLALAHQSHYHASGDPSQKDLAAKYMIQLGTHRWSANRDFVLSIGYLLEKGCFIRRDEERKEVLLSALAAQEGMDEGKKREMFERYFVEPGFGIGIRPQAALKVYKNMSDNKHALNRIGLLYHKEAEGAPESWYLARDSYTKAINFGSNEARCNMSVLCSRTNAEKPDIARLNRVVADEISTGVSNRAVVHELSHELVDAEKLYKKAITLDGNPIAKFNLSVLYMFGDSQFQSEENVSWASQTIADLCNPNADIAPMCKLKQQLELLRSAFGGRVVPTWKIDVEEIGDCLGYLKILRITRASEET